MNVLAALRAPMLAGIAFILSATALLCPIASLGEDRTLDAARAEWEKAVKSLTPRPSTDTTPVEFSVGGVHYRVPRNYLITMDNWMGGPQGLVTLRVNLPDLKPITQETRECFSVAPISRPPGCDPLQFTINAPGGVSADQAFANNRDLFHSQTPRQGPSGFEEYETGPDNARVEHYRKVSGARTLFYQCQIFDNHGNRDGLCRPVGDRLESGAGIQFWFTLHHLPDVERIDDGLRRLVENFTIAGEGSK